MADPVSGIDGPTAVGIGRYVDLTAKLASGKPATKVKWTYTEPKVGAKPQPLAVGPTVRYYAPSKLRGAKLTIAARNGSTKAFEMALEIKDVVEKPPVAVVKCVLDEGWKPENLHHCAKVGESGPFLVGLRKPGNGRRGLELNIQQAQFVFRPAEYAAHKHWAEIVACTTECEGKSAFEALNTYDRASFSFGLIQFGAHQYAENFHEYLLRAFAGFPTQAKHYFPELAVKGKDFFTTDEESDGEVQLTSKDDSSNKAFQRFIKPQIEKVTASEVLFAARMIHWCRAEPGMRTLMVDMAVERAKRDMKAFSKKLDGMGIAVCTAVYDTRVQRRGNPNTSARIDKALDSKAPLDQLLLIYNNKREKARAEKLGREIKKRFGSSKLTYNQSTNDFK